MGIYYVFFHANYYETWGNTSKPLNNGGEFDSFIQPITLIVTKYIRVGQHNRVKRDQSFCIFHLKTH